MFPLRDEVITLQNDYPGQVEVAGIIGLYNVAISSFTSMTFTTFGTIGLFFQELGN